MYPYNSNGRIGHGPDDVPALLDSAVAYVKIRAFSLPTSLLLGVVQSALLGAKDSVTPLIAILYSTIVNVVGDFFLVKIFGMGLRGAAIATLLAQLGRYKPKHGFLVRRRNSLIFLSLQLSMNILWHERNDSEDCLVL